MTSYVVTTEPTTEPLTLDELKLRLRITTCDFDTELLQILVESRKRVEADSYRKLITQTVKLYLDEFPQRDCIEIRLAPIQSITSLQYYDLIGTLQTFSSTTGYWTDIIATPPKLELRYGQTWPDTELERPNAVIVTFVAGYGAASAVPQVAKLAIVEYAKSLWQGCDGNTATYQRLVSSLQWTAYHSVEVDD